jgi:hypothetical protein
LTHDDQLKALAEHSDAVPGIPAVYLFGSRVRGDHRKDSDVDIRLFLNQWRPDEVTAQKADMPKCATMSLLGGHGFGFMSAFDPKRTLPSHEAAAKNWR